MLPMWKVCSKGTFQSKRAGMSQVNSDVNTESRANRTFSASDSDLGCSEESSDDSLRGSKSRTKSQYSYEDSKRPRLDNHPLTINLDYETMENAASLFSSQDSLFNSQESFTSEIYSSQPVSASNGVSEFCNQPLSRKTYMSSSQTFTRSDAEETNRQNNAKGKQSRNTKGTAKGQEELSLQEGKINLEKYSDQDEQKAKNRKYARDSRERKNNKLCSLEQYFDQDEQKAKNRKYARDSRERKNNKLCSLEQYSDQDEQKAKNRKYARDSRERKNNKLCSLEQANNHQRSVIQIYTKAITVFYKRLHGGVEPKWAEYNIPWYNSRDGECEKCQMVACLLPVEDNSFFEELGNNTFGTIIATHSAARKISISEIMPTHKNNLKMFPSTHFAPPLQRRSNYSQVLPDILDLTDNFTERQTRSDHSLSISRMIATVKPELHDKASQGGFKSLYEASSQIPILSQKAHIVLDPQQTKTHVNNPSSSTTFVENAHMFAAKHPASNNGAFNDERYIRAAQTSDKPCPIVAPLNISLEFQSFSDVLNKICVASNGSNLNSGQSDFIGYDTQPEHGPAFISQPEESTVSSLSQSSVFAPMIDAKEPEDSQGISSNGNHHQDIPDVEDLQSSLETA